jgi:hypothetical protein
MARITTTTQKKKMTMPGIAYPLMLRLATNASYPEPNDLFRYFSGTDGGRDFSCATRASRAAGGAGPPQGPFTAQSGRLSSPPPGSRVTR